MIINSSKPLGGLSPEQISRIAIAVGLLLGLSILVAGWHYAGLDARINWGAESLRQLQWFAAGWIAVCGASAILGPKRAMTSLATVFAVWLTAAFGIGPVAAVVAIGLGALALGDRLFGRNWQEMFGLLTGGLLSFSVGLTLFMFVIGISAHFPVNFQAFFVVLVSVPILLARKRLKLYCDAAGRWFSQIDAVSWQDFAVFAALLFVMAVQSVYAALPEQYHDALAQHLMVGTTLEAHGKWRFDPIWSIGSIMPQGANWIFSLGYVLAGESGAKLVNFGLLGVIVMLLGSTVASSHGRLAGTLVVLLFVSMPLTFIETASLYAENALTVFFLSAAILLMRSWEAMTRTSAVAVGLLLGGGALVKLHTVFFLLPYCTLAAFLLFRRYPPLWTLGTLALAAGGTVLIGIQPYAFAYWATGNPIFPFFNAIFKSPFFDSSTNFSDPRFAGLQTWHLLYDWTFNSGRYLEAANGALGFTLITFLLPGLAGAFANRDRPVLIAALLGFGYTIGITTTTQYLRYVYPVIPLLMMACAASFHYFSRTGVGDWIKRIATPAVAAGLGLTALNIAFVPTAGWILQSFQVDAVIDPRARDRFMSAQVPQRDLIEIVNALAGTEANVLVVGQPVGAGLAGKPFFLNWYNPTILHAVLGARTPEEVAGVLKRNRIGYAIAQMDAVSAEHPLTRFLNSFGRPIAKRGSVALYDVQTDAGFVEELVTNGDFRTGLTGWGFSEGVAAAESGPFVLHPRQSIVQGVNGSPQDLFLYSAEIECGSQRSYFQLQVNWMDAAGGLADVAIKPHYCVEPGPLTVSERFPAPEGTAGAHIYFNVPGDVPVALKRISIKR